MHPLMLCQKRIHRCWWRKLVVVCVGDILRSGIQGPKTWSKRTKRIFWKDPVRWSIWDVVDRFCTLTISLTWQIVMILSPISWNRHHQKVTNITLFTLSFSDKNDRKLSWGKSSQISKFWDDHCDFFIIGPCESILKVCQKMSTYSNAHAEFKKLVFNVEVGLSNSHEIGSSLVSF